MHDIVIIPQTRSRFPSRSFLAAQQSHCRPGWLQRYVTGYRRPLAPCNAPVGIPSSLDPRPKPLMTRPRSSVVIGKNMARGYNSSHFQIHPLNTCRIRGLQGAPPVMHGTASMCHRRHPPGLPCRVWSVHFVLIVLKNPQQFVVCHCCINSNHRFQTAIFHYF